MSRLDGKYILQVRRPLEPHEALGHVLFQPTLPLAVRASQLGHRPCLAALGLHPEGRQLSLLRHRLLPRIRLGAADGAALHEALERVAHLHGREEPLAHRFVAHGRHDLRLRLPREPFLDGAPLVASAVLR
eukprot:scaffold61447_cov59-Phaeocystis_antarctica.AAC.3